MADDDDKKDGDDKKDVAMKRPGNILNSAPDADRRIDTRIRGLVFWWSGITLFYLCSGLEIDTKKSSLLGIHFKALPEQSLEQTFLAGLLILNVVFWVRLVWRIYISKEYNRFYDEAVEDSDQEKNPKEETVEKIYEEKMWRFNRREKWGFGLLIPLVLGFVAIVCLSLRLPLPCLEIALGVQIVVLIIAIAILVCEYRYESEKNILEQDKKNTPAKNNGEASS